jgi:ribosomal protein S18 acetylase RimI-like enzyme
MHAVFRKDDWLSGQLGYTTGRLDVNPQAGFTETDLEPLLSDSGPDVFVYCKIPCTNLETVHRLEHTGFRVVETALTLERSVTTGNNISQGIRFVRDNDADGVTGIAAAGFSFSRFHLDPLIPKATADRIKAAWAANFFLGKRGQAMVVAEHDGKLCGFNLLLHQDQTLVIDLIAVAPTMRRQRMAAAMIEFAQHRLSGFRFIQAGTQAVNLPALRLYESLGFRTMQAHYVLHYHGPGRIASTGEESDANRTC